MRLGVGCGVWTRTGLPGYDRYLPVAASVALVAVFAVPRPVEPVGMRPKQTIVICVGVAEANLKRDGRNRGRPAMYPP
jgi:hypothetical protein